MELCPRCGSENKLGRVSCWKCWAPLPSAPPPQPVVAPRADEPPAPAPPSKEPLASLTGLFKKSHTEPSPPPPADTLAPDTPIPVELEQVAADPPLPDEPEELEEAPIKESVEQPVAPEPVPDPPAAPEPEPEPPAEEPCICDDEEPAVAESVVLPEIEDHEHGAVSAAGTPESGLPHGHFAYVTQPTVAAERQGMGWLLAVILVAIALLVAAMLYWRATFRPAVLGPLDVTKQYLSALAIGDTGTQDQLATTVSKRQRLPAWLGVMRSAVNPALHQQGDNAFVKVRLYLTPRAGVAKLDARVREAASRPYDIELRLQRDGADWRIDQQALFTSLRAKIVHENPQIPLPTD